MIFLHTQLTNPKDSYKKIQSGVKNPVYFKTMNNVRHVYTSNKSDFYAVQEKFLELKFQFQTFKPRDEIPKKMILKGMDAAFSTEDIYEDLYSQMDSVLEVKQLNKTTDKGEKVPINLYMVYFSYETRLSVAKKVIRALKNAKAPGFDQIKNVALKNLSRRAIQMFVGMINGMFRLNYFPEKWKIAKVLAFPKPNKPPELPSSYRPISLLSSLSKIVERICAIHFKRLLNEKNVLPNEQFGFRS